ncbi:MAG TPA: 2-amino-4-hydroxy-6-hydroxymethyldihydropteridine diphosphokinase [Candidatus Deferrimicrobiaceae bacterium]|nr:2-amino-4-hydroxy-6-hydroxymethyldihydropteridine diphosphokinase [Candidatus Deferrimicrobiaceae bacterium]
MTRPAIHVRRATAEDAEAAARVHAASSEAAYRGLFPLGAVSLERRVAMWRVLVEDRAAHSFVAEAGGQIVGVMNAGPADDGEPVGKLRILYVLPEWWGSRAGQVLLERAHTLLAADHDEAILTVLAANPRARRFYERNGWQFERLVVESHFGGQPIEVARYRRRLRPSTRARRVRAYVGLGSNVGDPWRTLEAAVAALASLPRVRLAGVSRLYRTRPVGVVEQPDFLNAVVALEVPLGDDPEAGAIELLVALKGLEQTFGRRARGRWGPRELDLDLLVFGRHAISVERPPEATPRSVDLDPGAAARLLEVPHPSMRERLFVLAPLGDLAPGLVPPGWPETVETARRRRAGIEADDAVSVAGDWTGERWRR